MKYCEICDGEGVIIDSTTPEDDIDPCESCAGMGVINVPQFIYLQIEPNLDEVSWADDRIYDNDLEYQIVNPNRPKIVCLCGSTRFWRTFQQASLKETLSGKIVLSIGAASGTDDDHFGNLPREEYDRIKSELDWLHFRKIELADEVLILNVDGYIGESTRNELEYAKQCGKTIRFLEPDLMQE